MQKILIEECSLLFVFLDGICLAVEHQPLCQ